MPRCYYRALGSDSRQNNSIEFVYGPESSSRSAGPPGAAPLRTTINLPDGSVIEASELKVGGAFLVRAGALVSTAPHRMQQFISRCTLRYAAVLPGRKSVFQAGFRPASSRECSKLGPPAGLRPAGGPIGFPDCNRAEIRPGSPISGPEALLYKKRLNSMFIDKQ